MFIGTVGRWSCNNWLDLNEHVTGGCFGFKPQGQLMAIFLNRPRPVRGVQGETKDNKAMDAGEDIDANRIRDVC